MTSAQPPVPPSDLLDRFDLHVEGLAGRGRMSTVWNVRGPDGAALVLKVSQSPAEAARELAALTSWRQQSPEGSLKVVEVVDAAITSDVGVLLLERLDPTRTADGLGLHDAVDLVIDMLHGLSTTTPSDEALRVLPTADEELVRLGEAITRVEQTDPGTVTAGQIARAREGIDLLRDAHQGRQYRVLHYDLHFLNVLHSAVAGRGWVVIDPLPIIGLPELELVPMLRNRWEEAASLGPDTLRRELEHRVDLAADRLHLDGDLARRFAQAVAVDNVGWMRTTAIDDTHYPAYVAMLDW